MPGWDRLAAVADAGAVREAVTGPAEQGRSLSSLARGARRSDQEPGPLGWGASVVRRRGSDVDDGLNARGVSGAAEGSRQDADNLLTAALVSAAIPNLTRPDAMPSWPCGRLAVAKVDS